MYRLCTIFGSCHRVVIHGKIELRQFSFCPNDIHTLLMNTHVKIEKWQILKVLKERWKLKPADNAYRYTTYNIDYNDATNYIAVQRTGRYYTVQRDFLEQLRC